MENKLLKIITNESEQLSVKNKIRLVFVYKYAIKNKLVTPLKDGAIYIAENQVEDTFLRLVVETKKDEPSVTPMNIKYSKLTTGFRADNK